MIDQKSPGGECLDRIFRQARTYRSWNGQPVTPQTLHEIWDLAKMGPTSANCMPARIIFVASDAARERLKPCLDAGNVKQTMAAAVTALICMDLEFFEEMPKLYPHADARSWFVDAPEKARATAFRNSSLQGAYFMLAARALGVDCGPMSGFDAGKLKAAFFPDRNWEANFICNLGHGTDEKLKPRDPRLGFDEACRIL